MIDARLIAAIPFVITFVLFFVLFSSKELLDKVKVIAEIGLIVVVIYYGNMLSDLYKKKEMSLEYLKLSIDIINKPLSPEAMPIREWAIEVFKDNAEPALTQKQIDIIERKPLSSYVMDEKQLQEILDRDGGYQKHLDAIERSREMQEDLKNNSSKK